MSKLTPLECIFIIIIVLVLVAVFTSKKPVKGTLMPFFVNKQVILIPSK